VWLKLKAILDSIYYLKKFWGKGTESIYCHIYFSLIMFNLVGISVAGLGDKFRNYRFGD
jgi:hypothetical protein